MSSELNQPLFQKVAVVTGASSGVGNSIALALAGAGANVALFARNLTALQTATQKCRESGSKAVCYGVDLLDEAEIREASAQVLKTFGSIDILVHSAGLIVMSEVATASLSDFDRQHRCNVLAPFILTQFFLPALTKKQGHVVFINSSVGLVGAPGLAQYSATKHALKAFADSLRDEVNPHGVRVLSVYLGRTATPMQAKVHRWESRPYAPEQLIQPQQVARVVMSALLLGPEAEVTDIRIRPSKKPETVQGSISAESETGRSTGAGRGVGSGVETPDPQN
jgi:NADP-dependent 3-hydroxy acid dehydrogenase YdfG